jgi:hypothetical protein
MKWDVFISHASEDKEAVARPLADLLGGQGLRVWLDENELTLGVSLMDKINEGLAQSDFGVVILSHAFFAKKWPKSELHGLAARESSEERIILPVWHGLSQSDICRYEPILADKLAASTDKGIPYVATEILRAVRAPGARNPDLPFAKYYPEDRQLFDKLTAVFNRPAFRGTFLWQTNPEPFQRVMRLTIKALNTGTRQDNAGAALDPIESITRIKDKKLYAVMQEVVTELKTIDNLIEANKSEQGFINSPGAVDVTNDIDRRRDGIINLLNNVWRSFGINTLPIPTEIKDSTDCFERFL